jgi:Uma2 family endonuclease
MTAQPKPRYTPQEYLARERQAEVRSEYFAGEIFAMSGNSRGHNLIVTNAVGELRHRLRHRPCEVYPSNMRVKVEASGLYTYPDVTVVCGEPRFEDAEVDTLLNPMVLMEVLSKSTEAYDRGKKSAHYRRLPSLRDYVLIAQDRRHVEVYSRSDDRWLLTEARGTAGVLHITALACEVPLAELYARLQIEDDEH